MENMYRELKNKHQDEVNSFPMVFAFSNQQFEESMDKLGLDPTETNKVCSIGAGGFILKTDKEAFRKMFERHERERKEAIEADKTGEGYIYDMFDYELGNHEYCITYDIEDALNALGLTVEEVENNPLFTKALNKACKAQREWYEIHG